MALKVLNDGTIVISSKKDAVAALNKFQALNAELNEIRAENGMDDIEKELVALKVSVTEFMVNKKLEQLEIDGAHATLIEQHYDTRFVGTSDDIRGDEERDVIPLKEIIGKKFGGFGKGKKATKVWNRVSRRVVVPELVEEIVSEGLLTVDEIAPSFIEKKKRPYLRIFED